MVVFGLDVVEFGIALGVLGDVLGFGELCGVADGEFGVTVVVPGSLGAAFGVAVVAPGVFVVALGVFVVALGIWALAPGMLFCCPVPVPGLVLCVPVELCPIPVPL